MKSLIPLFFCLFLFSGCASVEKYNQSLSVKHAPRKLKSDVDYIHKKLVKLHPKLYWYISKVELDQTFDSLKSELNEPLTSNEFYVKLSPVLASIKEGHLRAFQLNKRLKGKDWMKQKAVGSTPFARYEFETFDHKLYFVKNNTADSSVKVGTELISVNGKSPFDIINHYKSTFSSDGFNQTFIDRRLSKGFPTYFYYANGVTDSVSCEVRNNDSVYSKIFCRIQPKNTTSKKAEKPTLAELEKRNLELKKKRIQGYDGFTKTYSKNLNYLKSDSSIACMKIADFYRGQYKKFFDQSFAELKNAKTSVLILDMRDNPGGRIRESNYLNSYLTDKDFCFIDSSEVTSRFSLLHSVSFRSLPVVAKAIYVVFSPLRLITAGVVFSKVKKKNHKFYFIWKESKVTHPQINRFDGKVFVLINGGSFSATCLLSSNLKGEGKAVFVGEETGGAFNGTVAGMMPTLILPKTKLPVVFGLALIQPHYKSSLEGRGIFPDFEVKPKLKDRIAGEDTELNWILDKIEQDQFSLSKFK